MSSSHAKKLRAPRSSTGAVRARRNFLRYFPGGFDDPTYVGSDRPQPAILAGYSSVGFPGIVVPMGFGSAGLPMTISLMGRPYEEGRLIRYAYAYEQASSMRRPSPLLPALEGEVIG